MYLLTSVLLVFVFRWTLINGAGSVQEIGNGKNLYIPKPCNSKTEGKFATVKNRYGEDKLSVCVQEGKFRWKTGKALNRTEQEVKRFEDFENEQDAWERKEKRDQLAEESDKYLHKRVVLRERARCMCGWVPIDSSCYYFSTKKDTWSNARSYCLSHGGDLAVPINPVQNNRIWKTAQVSSHHYTWIGLERHSMDQTFYTVYGLQPTYTNWNTGEPNNALGNEHCTQLRSRNNSWNDAPCAWKVYYVCEHKQIKW